MSSLDSILDPLAPSFEGEPAEWEDVLHRAGAASVPAGRSRRAPRARLWFAVALLAVATGMAATPIGRAVIGGSFDRLSGWVGGGSPAPTHDAAGFNAANAQAYASFPQGTELRLLMSEQVAGVRFDLLGFRDGPSLCLRLVRADQPDSAGGTRCAPLRELERRNAPLAVVGGAGFLVGPRCDEGDGCDRQATRVGGMFGVATEAVTSVELITRGGDHLPARLDHGAFLSLTSQPTEPATPESEAKALDDSIEQATGITSQGDRVTVPVLHPTIVDLSGDHSSPDKASQLASLPGPTGVDYVPDGGSIGWLDRREPRGGALTLHDPGGASDMGAIVLARGIKPDPTNSFRVGMTLVRIENEQGTRPGARGETWLCVNALMPGWRGGLSGFCGPLDKQFTRLPFQRTIDGIAGQFPTVAGIASDDVAQLKLFFSHRSPEEVPLVDNAFALQLSGLDLPAKLVAYDAQGHVIGIDLVPKSDGIIGLPGKHG